MLQLHALQCAAAALAHTRYADGVMRVQWLQSGEAALLEQQKYDFNSIYAFFFFAAGRAVPPRLRHKAR
jgi:hypothetical protein